MDRLAGQSPSQKKAKIRKVERRYKLRLHPQLLNLGRDNQILYGHFVGRENNIPQLVAFGKSKKSESRMVIATPTANRSQSHPVKISW